MMQYILFIFSHIRGCLAQNQSVQATSFHMHSSATAFLMFRNFIDFLLSFKNATLLKLENRTLVLPFSCFVDGIFSQTCA